MTDLTLEQRVQAHRRRRIYERQVAAGAIRPRKRAKFDAAAIVREAIALAKTLPPEDPDEIAFRQFILHELTDDLQEWT